MVLIIHCNVLMYCSTVNCRKTFSLDTSIGTLHPVHINCNLLYTISLALAMQRSFQAVELRERARVRYVRPQLLLLTLDPVLHEEEVLGAGSLLPGRCPGGREW